MRFRFYSSGKDWKKLQSIIMDRIDNRTKQHSVQDMVPIAKEVLHVRMLLVQGVSILLQAIPTVSCKYGAQCFDALICSYKKLRIGMNNENKIMCSFSMALGAIFLHKKGILICYEFAGSVQKYILAMKVT